MLGKEGDLHDREGDVTSDSSIESFNTLAAFLILRLGFLSLNISEDHCSNVIYQALIFLVTCLLIFVLCLIYVNPTDLEINL